MIKTLKEYGLDSYEARAFMSLTKLGVSTAPKISLDAVVPYGKIYPVLYSLERKGFVKQLGGLPKRFAAIDPRAALTVEISRRTNALDTLKSQTHNLIEALSAQKSNSLPDEKIQVVVGKRNYLKLSVMLHSRARKSWKTIHRLPMDSEHMGSYRQLSKRGIKAQIITSQDRESKIKAWKRLGVDIRFIANTDFRFTVIDESDVVIRIGDSDKTGYTALWIQHPVVAKVLSNRFDALWKKVSKTSK